MKRLFTVLLLGMMLISGNSYAIVDWIQGLGTDSLPGTTNASDIDYGVTNYLQDPLDRLLANYVRGCTLTRTSATVITVSAGEVVCAIGAGTTKRMRQNTATTTMDMTVVGVGGIDSGSAEIVSTWYSIYAVADANATTFTVIATQQGVAPSDVTYYAYIGSAYNNAAGDLSNFTWHGTGLWCYVAWDLPVSITTATSSGAWSAAVSCATGMPSTSRLANFTLVCDSTVSGNYRSASIKPNGGTGINPTGAVANIVGITIISGTIIAATDSSQQISHYEFDGGGGLANFSIYLNGYWVER